MIETTFNVIDILIIFTCNYLGQFKIQKKNVNFEQLIGGTTTTSKELILTTQSSGLCVCIGKFSSGLCFCCHPTSPFTFFCKPYMTVAQ